ncbi:serine/threonine-protein phosphatase 7 long form-like [Quillaja saponaria]|uniref:Serine/threonine-protein phosphatase 7 long form-like n=1 Tax=Quillaja saponaria TaxID=32244 RepID=A0AAD7L2Q7_QUISA|nr:serine/threonine-protein phosphatase 7 long form-like [Quillaja saponaria]
MIGTVPLEFFTDRQSEAYILKCSQREAVFGREVLNNINHRALEYMTQAGFGGVIKVQFISLDLHLMTTLVERWRSETHTFHLPHNEATITLQDISILLGLPVDREPISGIVGADVTSGE